MTRPARPRPALIALAQQGASRSELQAEAARLSGGDRSPATTGPAEVARKLSSRRFLAGLSADDRRALDRWLARMPEALRG